MKYSPPGMTDQGKFSCLTKKGAFPEWVNTAKKAFTIKTLCDRRNVEQKGCFKSYHLHALAEAETGQCSPRFVV